MAQKILLDSGTNEVEILEFFLGKQSFGINVAKILQIIPYNKNMLTTMPDASKSVIGVILWREQTVNLIDLNLALNKKGDEDAAKSVVLITNFNNVTNSFLTQGVNKIHRINWNDIDPINLLIEKHSSCLTGSIHIEGREILLVDFEYIISKINPDTNLDNQRSLENIKDFKNERKNMKVVLAEDSVFMRNIIMSLLIEAGYTNITTLENGHEAFNYIKALEEKAKKEKKPLTDFLNLVISDIEMPKMDGLTLCRQVKQDLQITNIPFVMFSSLINEQMALKCQEVGGDGHISKPQIDKLVELMDNLLFLN